MSVPLKKEGKNGSLYRSILDTPDSYQPALEAIITEYAWAASYKVIAADVDTSNKNHQKILLRNEANKEEVLFKVTSDSQEKPKVEVAQYLHARGYSRKDVEGV